MIGLAANALADDGADPDRADGVGLIPVPEEGSSDPFGGAPLESPRSDQADAPHRNGGGVTPHPVHDDGQLVCDGDLGFFSELRLAIRTPQDLIEVH